MKEDQAKDISGHIVEINQLVNKLNRLGRETFNPDIDEINRIASQLESHTKALKQLMETV